MDKQDRITRLEDIEWALKTIKVQTVRPRLFRLLHHARINEAVQIAHGQLKALLEDARAMPDDELAPASTEE